MAGEQQQIPGMKPKKIKAIEEAFDAYMKPRTQRAALAKEMREKKQALLDTLKQHGEETYGKEYDGEFYVANVHEEEVIEVKKSKPDRE